MRTVTSLFINSKAMLLLGFLLVGSSAIFAQVGNEAKVIDKIVAQIGDEIILLSDIQQQRLQLLQSGVEGDKDSDCAILEEFLYEKLLVNQAKIDSVTVEDVDVNREMEERIRYIAGQIGSIEKLEEFYGKSVAKIKAEFFEMIKKRLLADEMKRTITQNVKITPSEVEKFFKKLPKDSIPYINSKVTVAHIVMYPIITQKDKEIAFKQLAQIKSEIESGKQRFSTAATLYTEDPGSRISGGDLGWQSRGTMVPEFESALFNLEPNEISEVIETQYGYHIIQLLERKGDNFHCRHILIAPSVSDQALVKAATTIDSVHSAITKGDLSFEEAARRFSDDENSKFNGGQIVNPFSGDYLWDIQNINEIDPQMSRIIERMSVNKFSTPSLYDNYQEQKQGIRIVKLIAKSEPHIASLKTDRQLIEMAALNEKRQMVIDAWIESKISGNYVQIDKNYLKGCKFKYSWIRSAS